MDELWLRELLDRATASEPPMGPVATNALRAGITRRRRRRAQGTAACVAAVAVIGAAAVAMTGAAGHRAAGPAKVTRPATVFVLTGTGVLRPIPTATDRPGKPIAVGNGQIMAITPDGKTVYVGDDYVSEEQPKPAVVPVSAVTDTAGKPILMGEVPSQILITPNGKTAYVLGLAGGPADIVPIATATNTPEKAIKVGMTGGGAYQMAITPDGKTLYVISSNRQGEAPSYVIPIATATNTPGKPIKIQNANVGEIVMNPDGTTAYAIGQSTTGTEIVPITTATNTPGKPVRVGPGAGALGITPDGQILYLVELGTYGVRPGPSGVIPFATATSTPGKLIRISGYVYAMAVTPDSSTAYVASEPPTKPEPAGCTGQTGEITPISTATNAAGRAIRVACDPYLLAITPDGKTVWVGSGNRTVTPIATATNTPGKPIKFRGVIKAIAVSPWAGA
jgi:DNA-binding beta-propeller fold protein YncE